MLQPCCLAAAVIKGASYSSHRHSGQAKREPESLTVATVWISAGLQSVRCDWIEAMIKGMAEATEMMTRDKHRRMAVLSVVLLMTLLWTRSLLAQGAAKDVPSARLAELSRSIEDLSARVSPAVVQVFAAGFRVNPEEACLTQD